ncbi:MAG: ABC transporter permease subunit [Bacilli bacterium]|jgi:arabinogalactan oligomer/maltooligosaccharide transport system permease protein|nr:ABC transporter permease subunit [Bacillota bacterium]HOA78321.1 ABC transporter permease subunit [Bacilli bacterium]HPZ27074.1 ABC transporter permease subunit [Bacilli bacterium]HQC89524.1 ABC transporter permease subunit [Bacilli bacterium]
MRKKIISRVFLHALLFMLAIITLFPFVYIVLIALGKNVISTNTFIPEGFTLDNFKRLFTETKFLNWLGNSLLIATLTMIAAVILVSVSVYVFSRLKFYGKRKLFNFVLLIQIFPLTLSMVSIFQIFVRLGLLNRMMGLVIVNCTLASAGLVMLAKGYFDSIPYEIDEAAMMDGASVFQILTKITLPLAKPMLAIVAIQSFVIAYNEYTIASAVMTTNVEAMPLAVGLQSMITGQYGINWSIYCAGAVLGSIPMIILFYSLQKNFIGGLTEGGGK